MLEKFWTNLFWPLSVKTLKHQFGPKLAKVGLAKDGHDHRNPSE